MDKITSPPINRLRLSLGLERNISVLLVALVLLGLREELWSSFVPKYLEALGAGVFVWTGYQTIKDLLDAVYQYGVFAYPPESAGYSG